MRRRQNRSAEEHPELCFAGCGDGVSRFRKGCEKKESNGEGLGVVVLFVLYVILVVATARWWVYSTCKPLGLDAYPEEFSEARAMEHVKALSEDIGYRQVGTPGIKAAAEYVTEVCKLMASEATESGGLTTEVDVESAAGSWYGESFHITIAVASRNFTNIILFLSPPGMEDKKALMINAHYDSAHGSPGASDCAVCVAISLEIARVFTQNPRSLAGPIIFLFNGGEETGRQGSNGFMKTSKWAERVGAFINLESTGSGGMPILFQYSGLWALRAYVNGAAHPRGAVIAQDFFSGNFLPAETDFRMLARDSEQHLPGIDIAQILDASAYHNNKDSYDRIRPGTTQEYGETVLGVAREFLRIMKDGIPSNKNDKNAVYFDVFYHAMAFISVDLAMWLHWAIFGIIGIAWYVQSLVSSSKQNTCTIQIKGALFGIWSTLSSLVLSVLLPMGLAVAWVHFTGKAQFWYSDHFSAYMVYASMALAGVLIPWQPDANSLCISSSSCGTCILLCATSYMLMSCGLASSYFLALMACVGALSGITIPKERRSSLWILPAFIICFFSVTGSFTLNYAFVTHVMEKMQIAGTGHPVRGLYKPDAAIAAVLGFGIWETILLFAPHLVGSLKRVQKRLLVGFLVLLSLFSLTRSGFNSPFSAELPRRVFVQYVENIKEDRNETYWAVGATDPFPLEPLIHELFGEEPSRRTTGRDWSTLIPLAKKTNGFRVHGPVLKVPPWGSNPPRVALSNMDMIKNGQDSWNRMYYELLWEKPGWGVLTVHGPLTAWSFSRSLPARLTRDGAVEYNVKLYQDSVDPKWPFWIDIVPNSTVRIDLCVSYLDDSQELQKINSKMPEWAVFMGAISYRASYSFGAATGKALKEYE